MAGETACLQVRYTDKGMRSLSAWAVAFLCWLPGGAQPATETFTYNVEWRLIHAGNAKMVITPTSADPGFRSTLHVESAGLVSKLYRVNDDYAADYQDQFCATDILLHAQEGSRKRETKVTFDRGRRRASYLERDVAKNTIVHTDEIDTPNCVHDIIGALMRLRTMKLDVGQSAQLPISDGKKAAAVKVESQEKEEVRINKVAYKTTRYEAFLFSGVIYRRNAQVLIWLTDDARRLPVQIRLRLPFPIGSITLQLQSEEKS